MSQELEEVMYFNSDYFRLKQYDPGYLFLFIIIVFQFFRRENLLLSSRQPTASRTSKRYNTRQNVFI